LFNIYVILLNKKKNIIVIGSGFSSLSAASYLAKKGHRVTILEKNDQTGGRSRSLHLNGFTFDMGPTWYWMPDVFEKYFADFNKKPSEYYNIELLDPGYTVVFEEGKTIQISPDQNKLFKAFEKEEPGSSIQLEKYLNQCKSNYDIAIKDMVYLPGESPLELVNKKTIGKVGLFLKTIRKDAQKNFKSKHLQSIIEFPVLFLGSKPDNTPAFYNFMNYADLVMGTWYPKGGMKSVSDGMEKLAKELGVEIKLNTPVSKIIVEDKVAKGVMTPDGFFTADVIVSGADYHHSELLLDKQYRQHSETSWKKKVFAPSALLFYVGLNKKLKNATHHMLFFDKSFDAHAKTIYDDPSWPEDPLFYLSVSSKTDNTAPKGHENLTFLVPLANDIEDTEELREKYFKKILTRLNRLTNNNINESDIVVKQSYCLNDFKEDYNSYGGNAYGLANILKQTAFLRPKIHSKKVNNLFFAGQLTVPGPGVPPALISGKLADGLIQKHLQL